MDYDIDYGDMSGLDFGDIDLSGLDLGNLDLGGLDLGDIDLSGLEGLDLSGIDLGSLENMDIGGMDLGGLEGMDFGGGGDGVIVGDPIVDEARGGGSDTTSDYESNFDDIDSILNNAGRGSGGARSLSSGNRNFGSNFDLGSYEDLDAAAFAGPDYGSKGDVGAYEDMAAKPFDMKSAGWQKTKDGRYVLIQEDGSAQGIDEDGNSFALSESQVKDRIKSGDLNTYESGYNTATGGTKIAPGGGSPVTLKNGKEGQLMPDGKVIDKDTGKVIGTDKDVKTGTAPKSGSGDKSSTGDKKNDLSYLLPLLLAMMAMNRGGGGSSSGAVIPSLSADRKQLPYGPSSGEVKRPGAGGTTYFSPTTYTKKAAGGGMMYGGGGISNLGGYSDGGRLLRGPGDGVSDSIPATIGGKQPARLATGEFVVPARIVSELGNGSTEAGAKKLYAMMDRVQKARRKTKNVAADTKAHKYLPA
jgi:hypothetical protein